MSNRGIAAYCILVCLGVFFGLVSRSLAEVSAEITPAEAQSPTQTAVSPTHVPLSVTAEAPVVSLQELAITKTSSRVDYLTGKIVNHGTSFVDRVIAKIDYCDTEGNTVAREFKKVLDKTKFTYHTPLQPGYSREFSVALNNTPDYYYDANISVYKVKTKEYDEYTVPVEPKLGIGMGWPYGGCGFNLELLMANYYAVCAGVGSASLLENALHPSNQSWTAPGTSLLISWGVGTRLYFGDPTSPIRGRFGFFFGPTYTYIQPDNLERDVILGYQPSLGFQWRIFKNVSLDLDVAYVMPAEHSRDYTYTVTQTGTSWNWDGYYTYTYSYKRTEHTDFPNYVSPSVGITVHFGDHGKIYDDKKEPRYIHTRP